MTTKQLIARVGLVSLLFIILSSMTFGMVASIGWIGALIVWSLVAILFGFAFVFVWCLENM